MTCPRAFPHDGAQRNAVSVASHYRPSLVATASSQVGRARAALCCFRRARGHAIEQTSRRRRRGATRRRADAASPALSRITPRSGAPHVKRRPPAATAAWGSLPVASVTVAMCSTCRHSFDEVPARAHPRHRGPPLVLGRRPAYRGFGIRETESIDVHLLLRLRESPWTGYGPTSSRRRWAFALALPRADHERRRLSIPMGGHKIGARGCAGRPARLPRRPASSTPWGTARGARRLAHPPPGGGQPHGLAAAVNPFSRSLAAEGIAGPSACCFAALAPF